MNNVSQDNIVVNVTKSFFDNLKFGTINKIAIQGHDVPNVKGVKFIFKEKEATRSIKFINTFSTIEEAKELYGEDIYGLKNITDPDTFLIIHFIEEIEEIDPNISIVSRQTAGAVVFRKTESGLEFLLVGEKGKADATNKDIEYGFPGGGIEKGETLQETIVREVKEETGYSIFPSIYLTNKSHKHYFSDKNIYYFENTFWFAAEVLANESQDKYREDEIYSTSWLASDDVLKYLMHNDQKEIFRDFLKLIKP